MKITNDTYTEMRDGIQAIVDRYGYANISETFQGNANRMMWHLFNKFVFDIQSHDTHPAYTTGRHERVVQQKDVRWLNTLYDSGVNDTHIATALRNIMKEINHEDDP